MGDITKHFSWWEFRSKDGAPTPESVKPNIIRVARMLELLRSAVSDHVGRDCPLIILSGYRSPAHNTAVGGVPTSFHLKGLAADIVSRFASPHTIQSLARSLQARGIIGGLGVYAGFTHVDLGPRRNWTEATRTQKGGENFPS
jgi:uncharacterized protein YcbK (DUF882 family)